jgi:hypothetical protein
MKSFPRYGIIRNLKGKRRIIRIDGDTVHFEEEGVASRAAHRSRVTFLPDKPKPPEKWEQGTLFEKRMTGVVHKVLVETKEGWIVQSKKGKALSKPATREQALKRLRQIEYYKKQGH